jgi:NAD(P)-dependent dehydrogenase (short-subunit alcohol dehydrogenase family)
MYLTCRAVLPQMLEQRSGAIVNISSVASIRVSYPQFAYSVSKAGVDALTRTLAVYYADQGIRVNAVMPGLIETPLIGSLLIHYDGDVERMRSARSAVVPMKRMGTAWDIADASVFLASDEARYITGQVLAVDGGYTCASRVPA